MRRLLSLVLMFVWALWFGGMMSLLLFITTLFKVRRDLAGDVGGVLFPTFERYELTLAGIGLISSAGLWLLARRRATAAVFVLLALATAGAAVSHFSITPRINALRDAGETKTAEFRSLHGRSMGLYMGGTIALVVAGFLIPGPQKQRR